MTRRDASQGTSLPPQSGPDTDAASWNATTLAPEPIPAAQTDVPPAPGDPVSPFHSSEQAPSLPPLASPRRIERYTLHEQLGRGGMGVVFRAWDDHLQRPVALKMLLWGSTSPEAERRRFLLEARAVARLDHPGIVRVLDSGVHEGCPYFTMEFVEGPTLRAYLEKEGALPPRAAAQLLAHLARAVHHAHERGIVHRDIKPDNVVLEAGNLPRIMDFGIARLTMEEGAGLTVTGQVLGTPAYMSPEQAAGLTDEVGPASDIYALGAVFFHLLSGRPPFEGGPQRLHLRGLDPPPSLRTTGVRLPTDVERICQKAMAPSPRDRYASAQDLAEDAERVVRGEPVRAARPSLTRRLSWLAHKHGRQLAAAFLTLLLALALIGGWKTYSAYRLASLEAEREALSNRHLVQLTASLDPLWRAGEDERAAELIQAFLALPEVEGTRAVNRVLLLQARHALERERLEDAEDLIARAYVQARDNEEQLEALYSLAELYRLTGNVEHLSTLNQRIMRRQPRGPWSLEAQTHQKHMSLTQRQIPTLLSQLSEREKQVAGPFLTHIYQTMDTGQSADDVAYPTQRTRGLFRPSMGQGSTTGLLLRPGPVGNNIPPTLVKVAPPSGWYFTQPLLELGSDHGSPLYGVSLESTSRERKAGLYRLVAGRLQPVLDLPLTQLLAGCSGDLDRDGKQELYLAGDRKLLVALAGEGDSYRLEAPNAALNLGNSEIHALFSSDLDSDGHPELGAVVEGWRAFDLRIFRAAAGSHLLVLAARRKLGAMIDAAPITLPDGQRAILAVRNRNVISPRIFPAAMPAGTPRGVYLLTLQGGHLEILDWIPQPALYGTLGRLMVADLDGDGLQDFAVPNRVSQAREGTPGGTDRWQTLVGLGRPDGTFASLSLPGMEVWTDLELDGDPAEELLVVDETTHRLRVLGAGHHPLPGLPITEPEPVSVQGSEVWQRLEDLLALGLTRNGIEQLRLLARTAVDPVMASQALMRTGDLELALRREDQAARLYEAAAYTYPSSLEPLRRAILARRALWDYDAELDNIQRLLKFPQLAARERAELEARKVTLRKLHDRDAILLNFDRPLSPLWHIWAPHLLQRDAAKEALVVHSLGDGEPIAHLPFLWKGGKLSLELELIPRRIEWGSYLTLGIRSSGPTPARAGQRFAVVLQGRGGGGQLYQEVGTSRGGADAPVWSRQLTSPHAGVPVKVRLELDPQSGDQLLEINGQIQHFVLPPEQRPVPGMSELYLEASENPWPCHGLLEVEVPSLSLKGATLLPAEPDNPLQQAARALIEGLDQGESIGFPSSVEALLRPSRLMQAMKNHASSRSGLEVQQWLVMQTLVACRQGQLEPCTLGVQSLAHARHEGLSHAPAQPFEPRTAPGRLARSALWLLTRESPALVFPALWRNEKRCAMRSFQATWMDAALSHPDDLQVKLGLTSGLAVLEGTALEPVGDLEADIPLLRLLILRGRSQRLLGQHGLARAALDTAWGYGKQVLAQHPRDPRLPEVMELLSELEVNRGLSLASTYQVAGAVEALKRALELTPLPELLGDELVLNPALLPHLDRPELRSLLNPSSFQVPPPKGERLGM